MKNLQDLKKSNIQYRKNKNTLLASLTTTLLGEIESQSKLEGFHGSMDQLLIETSKTFHKNLKSIQTEDSVLEMEELSEYFPQLMSREETEEVIKSMSLPRTMNSGARIGAAMKVLKGKADGAIVKSIILGE